MRGTVGTSTTIQYVKDKRKSIKARQRYFCFKCRGYIAKDTWMKPFKNGYAHMDCKTAANAARRSR